MSLSILFLRFPLARIYLDSPAAIEACSIRLLHTLTAYFTLASMDTGSGIVRGLNRSIMSTVVSLMGSCVLRIVWIATVARAYPTLNMVYISYPISWGITGLCHFIVAMVVKKKMLSQHPVDED